MFGGQNKSANRKNRNHKNNATTFRSCSPRHLVYCPNCGKPKLQFHSQKSAERYLHYCSNLILEENGYAPIRCYYCSSCRCWHVTSQPLNKVANNLIDGCKSTLNHDLRRWLNRLDQHLNAAFSALKEGQLKTAEQLCNKAVELYGKCLLVNGYDGKKRQLFERLQHCVHLWMQLSSEYQKMLFRVEFKPQTLFSRPWDMY